MVQMAASDGVFPILIRSKMPKPNYKIKRAMDLGLCLASLPLTLPLCLLIGLAILLESGAFPIYRQKRMGRGGKTFTLYKFRTMIRDADQALEKCLTHNPQIKREWSESQKIKKDPRITRIGRILRKSSLDELPQIFNILLGHMSLVGPRPIVANEINKYGRYYSDYCLSYPGLTGLWQVSGRNDTSYRRRVAHDHYYVNNWRLSFDLYILIKTIPVIISGKGAY